MVALARCFLDDPHWGWHAAKALGAEVARPVQYAARRPEAVGAGGGQSVSDQSRLPRRPVRRAVPCRLERADQGRARAAHHDDADRHRLGGRGAVVLPFVGMPAAAAWPWLDRLGRHPSRLFRRADRGLSHRRHGPGLSDRARLGAADDGDGEHALRRREPQPRGWIGIVALVAGVLLLSARGGRDLRIRPPRRRLCAVRPRSPSAPIRWSTASARAPRGNPHVLCALAVRSASRW